MPCSFPATNSPTSCENQRGQQRGVGGLQVRWVVRGWGLGDGMVATIRNDAETAGTTEPPKAFGATVEREEGGEEGRREGGEEKRADEKVEKKVETRGSHA